MTLDPIDDWYSLDDLYDALESRDLKIHDAIERGDLQYTEVEGIGLVGVHDPARCEGERCVIHNPTDHHMRAFNLIWRDDRGLFERICPHGIGHPDPDQFEFWKKVGMEYMGVHGCDGCCR